MQQTTAELWLFSLSVSLYTHLDALDHDALLADEITNQRVGTQNHRLAMGDGFGERGHKVWVPRGQAASMGSFLERGGGYRTRETHKKTIVKKKKNRTTDRSENNNNETTKPTKTKTAYWKFETLRTTKYIESPFVDLHNKTHNEYSRIISPHLRTHLARPHDVHGSRVHQVFHFPNRGRHLGFTAVDVKLAHFVWGEVLVHPHLHITKRHTTPT